MSMKETYASKILTEILREFLDDGIVPTADQLTEAYRVRTLNHPNMAKPFLSDEDHSVEEYSESSASAYNEFFERVLYDSEALYEEIWDRMTDSMDSFDRWRIELEQLKKKLQGLNRRVDSLLILRDDTAGYFNYVEDSLVDFSQIDMTNTTAKVDVVNHMVSLNDNLEDKDLVQASTIPVKDATFTVLTREHLLAATKAPNTKIEYAIEDVSRHWQHRVRSTRGDKQVTGELKVKIASSAIDIARIELELHASNTGGSMIITGMYSLDNYNWQNLPCDNYTQSADNKAVFLFPSTSMLWVKFFMTKLGADDLDGGQYVYEFGASGLRFFDTSYQTDTGDLFYSQQLSAYDDDDERVSFNKAALQLCQQTPEDTAVYCWIRAANDSATTEWFRIDPYNTDNPVAPTMVDFGKLTKTSGTDLYKVNKGEDDSKDYFGAYIDLIESDKLAIVGSATNSAYYLSASTVENMSKDSLVHYRNVGPDGGTPDEVRDAPRGWKYDANEVYMETVIKVENEDGLILDFGSNPAILDGTPVTDRTKITSGLHSFKTLRQNTTHRTLIEDNVDLYCEAVCKRIGVFDMLHNTAGDDYGKFAMDTIADGRWVFVVRFDPKDTPDHSNERFTLEFWGGSSQYDRVEFKAQLVSNNASKTPILNAFRIKLG